MTKHTAGPWTTEEKSGKVVWQYGEATLIGPRWEANARLIAAAPDMYDLLKAAVARIELANAEGNNIMSAWLPDALAAIAKAEGGK